MGERNVSYYVDSLNRMEKDGQEICYYIAYHNAVGVDVTVFLEQTIEVL